MVLRPLALGLLFVGPAWAGAEPAPPAAAAAEEPGPVEAISLLGRELLRPPLGAEFRERQERLLAEAEAAWEREPGDVDALIWVGRRTAYLGRFREALEIYGRGLGELGEEPRLLRHRGHRLITLRRLTEAIADLTRAAELTEGQPDRVEPDGLPNAAGIPTSTLQTNIWYHLGLARYLRGDWQGAAVAYGRCVALAGNPDMLVAGSYWRYLALRRLGRDREAAAVLGPVTAELQLLENHAYHRLLMMFKGRLDPGELLSEARAEGGVGFATLAYGVGVWHLLAGRAERAAGIFTEIVADPQWPAFGHLAAEAELARFGGRGAG